MNVLGYDMELTVFKKKTLSKIKNKMHEGSISDLYSERLFAYLHPEDYEIPKEEAGRYIFSESTRVFDEFFDRKIDNDEVIIIDEKTYKQMYGWLENKLKTTTLYDLVDGRENEIGIDLIIRIYKNMREEVIDFENEFVIYTHDW